MERLACDVLVIGAGAAGMRAAVAAQDGGARVVLAVKGKIGDSGASTFRVTEASGYGAADGRRCLEDNPDVHYRDILRAAHGMSDPAVVRRLVDLAPESVTELEQFGVRFEREGDGYLITQGCFGSLPRNYNICGHGTPIVLALNARIDHEKTTVLENCMIVDLIVRDGRCIGAVGLFADGRYVLISAKATVMAGGGAGQLFKFALNPEEVTGDSYALGYLAGAEITNMEFMQVGMGVLAPGQSILNSWIWSVHPLVTDGSGKSIFPEVMPNGEPVEKVMDAKSVHYPFSSESESRYIEIFMQKAIAEGRGGPHHGVIMDARRALKERSGGKLQLFDDMWRLTNDWFLRRGIDAENQKMEIACFAHAINGGLKIDPDARTTIAGLYAAGEASSGPHGADRLGGNMLVNCVVYGKIAGSGAAEEAKRSVGIPLDDDAYSPLNGTGSGHHASELIAELQEHMFNDMLVTRSQEKCSHLRGVLDRLKDEAKGASYEGMGCWTPYVFRNLLITAEMMLDAAEYRKESRGSHYREDYPAENPAYDQPYVIKRML